MLGPESDVYEPLPNPASIRVLVLVPGAPEDDVSCFLFPCDLDKDHARDARNPRPFENLCAVEAPSSNGGNSRQLILPLDAYIDDGAEDIETIRTASPRLEASARPDFPQDQSGEPRGVAGNGGTGDKFTSVDRAPADLIEKNELPHEPTPLTGESTSRCNQPQPFPALHVHV
jgi:hypothetical protein